MSNLLRYFRQYLRNYGFEFSSVHTQEKPNMEVRDQTTPKHKYIL